jgi:hypothetical protein
MVRFPPRPARRPGPDRAIRERLRVRRHCRNEGIRAHRVSPLGGRWRRVTFASDSWSIPPATSPTTGAGEDTSCAEAASCTLPLNADAGRHSTSCLKAVCPLGTVCAEELGGGTRSVARCVAIPVECERESTCACMGTEAAACLFTSGTPGLFFCVDAKDGDAAAIDFVCKCN